MNETRVVKGTGTTSDDDAKGTAKGDAKGDERLGDVFDAATEGREPDAAASPRGATRDRPDDEPRTGVSRDPGRVSKKPRLVWTPELHMRFMNAVNHLGIKRAVPKTILSLMNVEGMTRENVASHLQKYRLYLKRLAGLSPNAPLPADIMQRAQPYSAFPGSGTGMNVPFMPTMEQMHAGLPPTQPPAGAPGMPNPNANHPSPAMGSFMAGMGGMPGGPPGVQTGMAGTMPFAPFGAAPPGQVALGVSDPYGAAAQQRAQQAYAAAGFGQFLNYMHGLQSSGYGAMPSSGAAPPSGGISGPAGPPGAEVTSAGGNAWQAGGGPPAAGAETKDT